MISAIVVSGLGCFLLFIGFLFGGLVSQGGVFEGSGLVVFGAVVGGGFRFEFGNG